MLATVHSRAFCFLVCSQITSKLEHKNYNFACGSVWVRNLFFEIKGATQTEGV
jgi:hypothetical protein